MLFADYLHVEFIIRKRENVSSCVSEKTKGVKVKPWGILRAMFKHIKRHYVHPGYQKVVSAIS